MREKLAYGIGAVAVVAISVALAAWSVWRAIDAWPF